MLPKTKIVVFHNLNNNSFYVKSVHSKSIYKIGYTNQYNHKIVYIYDIPYIYKSRDNILKVSLSVIISYLKKCIKLLEKLSSLY